MRTMAVLLVTGMFLSAGALTLRAGKALAYGGGGFGRGSMASSTSTCTQQRVCGSHACVWRTSCR
jgi:hypothetical protein